MMELPPLEYTLDNVVVGWREEAVSFAREHGYPLIVNSDQRPFHYFGGDQDIKTKWYEGIFDLGMRSLLPIPFDIERISLEDGGLRVVTRNNTKVFMGCGKLYIFDFENVFGTNIDEVVEDYLVYDLFNIRRGSLIKEEIAVRPQDVFMDEIAFIASRRVSQNRDGRYKDILVSSVIDIDDIKNFDFSETMVKLFLERKLRELKIKSDSGRAVKIEHSERHIIKNKIRYEFLDDLDSRIHCFEWFVGG